MDIGLAKTFIEIVATGSFVGAAERLHLTQTAVSARVRLLEEQVGRRLFVRNRAGARLTPAGERFAHYATALVQVCGVTSSTELDREGFEALMGLFEYLGFKPTEAKGANYGVRPGMASFAQLELIRALWREITRTDRRAPTDEEALNKWLLGTFKLSALRFLPKDIAPKVITALKAWKARETARHHAA